MMLKAILLRAVEPANVWFLKIGARMVQKIIQGFQPPGETP